MSSPKNDQVIRYSVGRNSKDNCPAQREAADFKAFAEAVLADRSAEKGMTYVCAPMAAGFNRSPEKFPGAKTWRAAHLAQPRCFLPLDFDGADTPESAVRALEYLQARYRGFAYTTASHTPEKPRWRAVLAQSRATTREEGIALGKAVQALIEAEVGAGSLKFDASVYRGEQPFFGPLHASNDVCFDGEPLNVDALLANAPPVKPKAKAPLERAKAEDRILRTLSALGMVLGDQGGGRFNVTCPFAHEHSGESGDSSTVYFQAHTNGYAEAHFKCLHEHCANRKNSEFMIALLARYTKETGAHADWAVAPLQTANPKEKEPKEDREFNRLLATAPKAMQAYVDWYMESTLLPHSVFALVSSFLFMMTLIGATVIGPRGARINLWVLLLAPSEAGKKDILDLPRKGCRLLEEAGYRPHIAKYEREHGSAPGLWWSLTDDDSPQQLFVDEELGNTICAMIAAKEGTEAYKMRKAYLHVYSCANDPVVSPTRYTQSGGKRKAEENRMPDIHYPFFAFFGTGTPSAISGLSSRAGEEGFTNRLLLIVEDGEDAIGDIEQDITPLPQALLDCAERLHQVAIKNPMEQALDRENANAKVFGLSRSQPRRMRFYADFGNDWKREMKYGRARAQELLDIWGRYAEKVVKVAMIAALYDSGDFVSKANFDWAVWFVRWCNERGAAQYKAGGGGASNTLDAMSAAFMHAFTVAPVIEGTDIVVHSNMSRFAGPAWRREKDPVARKKVIETLADDGYIEVVDLQPKGKAYRLLKKP